MKRYFKLLLIILPIIIILILLGIWKRDSIKAIFTPPLPVGCVDMEQVFQLDDFQKAKAELEKEKEALTKKFNSLTGKFSLEEQNIFSLQFDQKLAEKEHLILAPYLERLQDAVAEVARENGITVVLNKNIVVVGIRDITSQVIKKYKSSSKIEKQQSGEKKSNIGYIDHSRILNSPSVKKVNQEYLSFFQNLKTEFETKSSYCSKETEKEQLLKEYNLLLLKKKQQLVDPVFQRIDATITKIARRENLSLVLSKGNIIYGGKDITEMVIKEMEE